MRAGWLLVLMLSGPALCLGAEVYPSKPVRVIVPTAPGGGTDFIARTISKQLGEQLGTSFIVDNRTGASGTIGNEIVAKAAADGYTLSIIDPSFTTVPGLFKSLPYDPIKGFAPITQIVRAPEVLVVSPSLKVNTLKEFIALAQANPGKLNYGAGTSGSANHLWTELFKIAAKVNVAHIPYKGGGDLIAALLGGQVQMQIAAIPAMRPFVERGQLRALAVTTDGTRTPSMPDVPSMSEVGLSGMTVYTWQGLVGTAGIPKEIVNKLHAEVGKAIALPSVRQQLISQGAEPVGSSPQEFSLHIRNELQRWIEVIKLAGIKAD